MNHPVDWPKAPFGVAHGGREAIGIGNVSGQRVHLASRALDSPQRLDPEIVAREEIPGGERYQAEVMRLAPAEKSDTRADNREN